MVKIAVIGGTGLDNPEFMSNIKPVPAPFQTPYGPTTDSITSGVVNGVEVVLIGRHGKNHRNPPSSINYRANIYAINHPDMLGCDAIIATNAVGSLRADKHQVGDLVLVDQFIDFTAHGGGQRGPHTFFDNVKGHMEGLVHCPMAEPFCKPIRRLLYKSTHEEGIRCHYGGCCVVIEGPRFSSKSEHKMFKCWGGDIINMTMVPEVCLANELGIPYATIALITDLDSGIDEEDDNLSDNDENKPVDESVTHNQVLENMKKFAPGAARTIARAIVDIANLDFKKLHNGKSSHETPRALI